jgi:Flp pilus assembly protein TadG
MQQISPPLRIALVAIVLLGALWFTVLRPKPDTTADAPLPQAPGVTGLATATQKAQGAVGTANKAAATEQATGTDAADAAAARAKAKATATKSTKVTVTKTPGATKVTKTTTVKKAPAKAANPAAPLLTALGDGKVVVLLFRNTSSDSADVSTMVRSIGKRKKVVSRLAWIRDVGDYQTFTADTPIQQAPTVMVIGPKKNVKLIVGFTSVGELAQAVADVRRAGTKSS